MAITSAPHGGSHTEHRGQLVVIAAWTAAVILAAIGLGLWTHSGGSSPGSGVQGSGIAATQTRTVARFSSLDLAGSNTVTVVLGAYAAGTATRLDVTLSGDGMAQLDQLTASQVHAVVSGSGLIKVTATTSLDAAVPGTGAIVYSGNPSQVASSVTGTGTVTPG